MRILFFVPHLNVVNAGRTIYHGYKNAFVDMGHDFRFLTAEDNQNEVFSDFNPHILFTGLNSYILKFLSLKALQEQKRKGMKVFVNTPYWNSPLSKLRVNETPSLSDNMENIKLIKSGKYGDVYYNVAMQGDKRMEGFEKATGYKHYTIPLAADKKLHFFEYADKFKCDISFLGTNLPDKREFIRELIKPIKKTYNVKFFGQGWTTRDRVIGSISIAGKYFNIPVLKSLQKPKLALEDERRIYSSSTISLNIHEKYQRELGGDCNERTFKIPACGGFELCDDIRGISEYLKIGKEIVVAKNLDDWIEKIEYFIDKPKERQKIIQAGQTRVLQEHTYNKRVEYVLEIYKKL